MKWPNVFGKKYPSDGGNWQKFTMPEQTQAAVALRHEQCRAIDEEIAALRDRKRVLSREIADIEAQALNQRPPNPKGTMTIGM
jgi:hypothetical protein